MYSVKHVAVSLIHSALQFSVSFLTSKKVETTRTKIREALGCNSTLGVPIHCLYVNGFLSLIFSLNLVLSGNDESDALYWPAGTHHLEVLILQESQSLCPTQNKLYAPPPPSNYQKPFKIQMY